MSKDAAFTTRAGGTGARSSQIYGLDLLRFFSAMLVATYHFTFVVGLSPAARPDLDPRVAAELHLFDAYASFAPWTGTGWVGVQIFFVISGFVIAYTANGKSPLTFFNSRFLRLWPAVVIIALISVPLLLWDGQSPTLVAREFANSVLLSPIGPWVADAFWTLTIEMIFYALILIVLLRNAFVRIERVAIVLGLLSTLVWIGFLLRPVVPFEWFDEIFRVAGATRTGRFLLLQDGCLFALGTMLWLMRFNGITARRVGVVAVLVAGCVMQIIGETQKAVAWNGYDSSAWVPVSIWLVGMLVLVASIVWNEPIAARVKRAGAQIRAIGLMTYPLYLLHLPVGMTLLTKMLELQVDPMVALATALAISAFVALIVAQWLEPALRHRTQVVLERLEAPIPSRWPWLRHSTTSLSGTPLPAPRLATESPP